MLKCRLIRDSCHLKEGIPEKIAAEALCKTIDFNLEQLNHPEYYEGDTRREYKLSLKNAKSERKGLEEKIEKWLTLRYAMSGMVDGDEYEYDIWNPHCQHRREVALHSKGCRDGLEHDICKTEQQSHTKCDTHSVLSLLGRER